MTEEQMIEAQSQISRYSIYLFFNIIQQGQNDDENPVSQVLSKQIQIWEVAPHWTPRSLLEVPLPVPQPLLKACRKSTQIGREASNAEHK